MTAINLQTPVGARVTTEIHIRRCETEIEIPEMNYRRVSLRAAARITVRITVRVFRDELRVSREHVIFRDWLAPARNVNSEDCCSAIAAVGSILLNKTCTIYVQN